MKKKLFFCLLLMPLSLSAQIDSTKTDLPYKDGRILFESTVQVEAVKQAVLYTASKKWMAELFGQNLIAGRFENDRSVIQTENKEAGQVVGSGQCLVATPPGGNLLLISLNYRIKINCKDELIRIRIYDLQEVVSEGRVGKNYTETNIT
jgi:hypothetical protein